MMGYLVQAKQAHHTTAIASPTPLAQAQITTTSSVARGSIGSEADAEPPEESTTTLDVVPAPVPPLTVPSVQPHGVHVANTSTTPILDHSRVAFLRRMAGDPMVEKGEVAVRVPIFMYHHVRDVRVSDNARQRAFIVRPAVFEAQMKGLVDAGYTAITPDMLMDAVQYGAHLPEKPVLLTFDDGFREHYTTVLPILQKYHLKAAFLVVSEASNLPAYMTREMWKLLAESGLATIVDHTEHHAFLTHLSAAKQIEEIHKSRQTLQEVTGQPVNYFGYPYGDWNQQVLKELKTEGYRAAFGVRLGALHTSSSAFLLRRIRVQDPEDVTALADAFSQSK